MRAVIDNHLAQGRHQAAATGLRALWREAPTLATAGFIESRMETLRCHVPLTSMRLAIVRTFTVEPVVPLLRAAAFANGLDLEVLVGDFNVVAQQFLDPESPLYRFDPDTVILASQTRDISPEIWNSFAKLVDTAADDEVAEIVQQYRRWFRAFRSNTAASLIVHGMEMPAFPACGVLDAQREFSQTAVLADANRGIQAAARSQSGIYFLDYDNVVSNYGRLRWYDERRWLTTRLPICADGLPHLADAWVRHVLATSNRIHKVLVTDLDNTLWGGVVGEDSLSGIKLGSEYPGAAFLELQRVMLDLHQRGILLAVSSKNNPSDALEAIEKHPAMLLRRDHFAALRINWNEKTESLREIASELNVGIDSLVFIDDSPVECEKVRRELPEVSVVDLPSRPEEYAYALRKFPVFERLTLSDEDGRRGTYYTQQSQRNDLHDQSCSLEDFYYSLKQHGEIGYVSRENVSRVAQLTQKTNQFNLTTHRYMEQEIGEIASRKCSHIWWLRVSDRFGDNGIVGVSIVHVVDDVAELNSFLLSCRVLGRTVESAFLAGIGLYLANLDVRQLSARFIPSKKNKPAATFLPEHGFAQVEAIGPGSSWVLDLEESPLVCPNWIDITLDHTRSCFYEPITN